MKASIVGEDGVGALPDEVQVVRVVQVVQVVRVVQVVPVPFGRPSTPARTSDS